MSTLYDVLGVAPDAAPEAIRRAYRALARENHPDRGGDQAVFQGINAAYEVLSSPQARASYDQSLAEPVDVVSPAEPPTWGEDDFVEAPVVDRPTVSVQYASYTPPAAPAATRRRPPWLVLGGAAVILAGIAILFIEGQRNSNAFNTALLLFMVLPFRAFLRRAWFAVLVAAGVLTALVVMQTKAGVSAAVTPALAAAVVMIAGNELVRAAVRRSARRKAEVALEAQMSQLAAHWQQTLMAAQRGGRLYWLANAQPRGQQTYALLYDPQTGQYINRSLWGPWPAGVWAVVDPAGVVLASCPDEARAAASTRA